jgi:beta-glucosidase
VRLEYQKYIDAMTLQEKASMLSGANFWHTKPLKRLNIPSVTLTDGPHGLRKQAGAADHLGLGESVKATCFPTAAALASSWDEKLLQRVGDALGDEAAANKVSVLLGPGLNIVRDPLAGRAFEYFSEDSYVAGKLAAAMVRGIQTHGVAATPKHFAVNSQEYLRMSIDEVVDERTMREIYLEGFRRVVQESKPKMLMTSYNKINGTYASENQHTLQDILIKEWKYDGATVTDWGGNNNRVAGLKAGNTLEMPSSNGATDKEIYQAVKKGILDESIVDAQVDKLLSIVLETSEAIKSAKPSDLDAHHELAVEAAERSMVLLKNDSHVLPIASGTTIALIGDFAQTPRYQGAGSSLVNPTRVISAIDAFTDNDLVELIGYEPGFKRTGGKSNSLIRSAVALAKKAEVAIVFIGLDEAKEAEGIDRKTMELPANQLALLNAISAVHNNVVVVSAAGGPVEMSFADDVASIIHSSLGGQGVGRATANIITGLRTPSGKLAVSYPFIYGDAPTANYFPGKEKTAEHREGLYVGYRYYETAEVAVRYPFGFGLSYTTFSYSDIIVKEKSVTFSITNDGDLAGEEIAQMYIRPPKSATFRPVRELKGFTKVSLQPGQTKKVTIDFDSHTFAHYHISAKAWVIAKGEYGVEIGASVQDIRLQAFLNVNGVGDIQEPRKLKSYHSGKITRVSDKEFETLLGRPRPIALWNRQNRLTLEDTIMQMKYSRLLGRLLYGFLRIAQKILFILKKPNLANNMEFIMNLPFSRISGFAGGKISNKAIERFLKVI